MALIVIHHLSEQGLADSIKVYPFRCWCPPQMKMGYWLLKCSTAFVLAGRFDGSSCFKPEMSSCLRDYFSYEVTVVTRENLELKTGCHILRNYHRKNRMFVKGLRSNFFIDNRHCLLQFWFLDLLRCLL